MSVFMETSLKRVKMIKEWRVWARRIANVVKELLPNAEVYVFGSVVRGNNVASSDVDILIVSPNTPGSIRRRAEIKAQIEDKLNLPYYHPFQIHIVNPEEARIYFKRIRKHMVKVA